MATVVSLLLWYDAIQATFIIIFSHQKLQRHEYTIFRCGQWYNICHLIDILIVYYPANQFYDPLQYHK